MYEARGKLVSKSAVNEQGLKFFFVRLLVSHVHSVFIIIQNVHFYEELEVGQQYHFTGLKTVTAQSKSSQQNEAKRMFSDTKNTAVSPLASLTFDCTGLPSQVLVDWKPDRLIEYEGTITAIFNLELGIYVIDESILLFLSSVNSTQVEFGSLLRLSNVHVWSDQKLKDMGFTLGLTCCCYSTVQNGSNSRSPWYCRVPPTHQLFLHESYKTLVKSLGNILNAESILSKSSVKSVLACIYAFVCERRLGKKIALENPLDFVNHDSFCRMNDDVFIDCRVRSLAEIKAWADSEISVLAGESDFKVKVSVYPSASIMKNPLVVGILQGSENGCLTLVDAETLVEIAIRDAPVSLDWLGHMWAISGFDLVIEYWTVNSVMEVKFYLLASINDMSTIVLLKQNFDASNSFSMTIDEIYPVDKCKHAAHIQGSIDENTRAVISLEGPALRWYPGLHQGLCLSVNGASLTRKMESSSIKFLFYSVTDASCSFQSKSSLSNEEGIDAWSVTEIVSGKKKDSCLNPQSLYSVRGTIHAKSFKAKYSPLDDTQPVYEEENVLVVTLEDQGLHTVDVYFDLKTLLFPINLLPKGTMKKILMSETQDVVEEDLSSHVKLTGLMRKVSFNQNIYLWATACTRVVVNNNSPATEYEMTVETMHLASFLYNFVPLAKIRVRISQLMEFSCSVSCKQCGSLVTHSKCVLGHTGEPRWNTRMTLQVYDGTAEAVLLIHSNDLALSFLFGKRIAEALSSWINDNGTLVIKAWELNQSELNDAIMAVMSSTALEQEWTVHVRKWNTKSTVAMRSFALNAEKQHTAAHSRIYLKAIKMEKTSFRKELLARSF